MSKLAIVYWSGTGNTKEMATAIANSAQNAGAQVNQFEASCFTSQQVAEFDSIAFGCPSMGAEILEENEFQPMWDEVSSKLIGKKIALFGSYGWGDGEWMRNWVQECKAFNITLCDYVICNDAPDTEAIEALEQLALGLV